MSAIRTSTVSSHDELRALIAEKKEELQREKERSRQAKELTRRAEIDDVLCRRLVRSGCSKVQEALLILHGWGEIGLSDQGKLVTENGSTVAPELLIGRSRREIPGMFPTSSAPSGTEDLSRYDRWRAEISSMR